MNKMSKMNKFSTYYLIGFIIMFLISFVSGFEDDIYLKKYHEGIWYKDVLNYFEYYALWVIPYWWIIIILGGLILALIIFLSILLLRTVYRYTKKD